MSEADTTGPMGGKTTRTKSGMVRKNLWLHEDESEALRVRAFEERRTESSIMRDALRQYLALED